MVIKAVLCDLDGTLYKCGKYDSEIKKKTIEIVAYQLSITQSKAKKLLNKAKETCVTLTKSLDCVGVSRHVFYEELSKRLDYSGLLKPDPRIKDLIGKIHDLGFKFALVTNSGCPHALRTLTALSLPISCLDAFVTSSEIEPKISSRPYLRALALLQVTADEAISVGDRIDVDLKPAKELGIYTVLVSKKSVKSLWVDSTIESPFMLIDLLKMLR